MTPKTEHLERLSTAELRKLLRTQVSAGNIQVADALPGHISVGRWIGDACKEAAIRAITTGVISGDPSAGNTIFDDTPPEPDPQPDDREGQPDNPPTPIPELPTMPDGDYEEIKGEGEGDPPPTPNESDDDPLLLAFKNAAQAVKQADTAALQEELEKAKAETSEALDKMRADLEAQIKANRTPREVTIVTPEGERREVGTQHFLFDTILKAASARVHVWLVGPAGSGKTYLAESVARALDLNFYPISCGPEMSQFDLLGYRDATGQYIPGIFRAPFENGGLLLLDEIDAGSPAVMTCLNSALANSYRLTPPPLTGSRNSTFRMTRR